jgi:SAM-dependent methyltransferase
MLSLNVGCGQNIIDGWVNLDVVPSNGVDLVYDLEAVDISPLPFEGDSVSSILMSQVIEHLHRPLQVLQELWRVAKPGCHLVIRVPHGGNDEAWIDPTHVRPYFPRSFAYFGQPKYHRFDYGYTADWDCRLVVLAVPQLRSFRDIHQVNSAVETNRNLVSEMAAVLTAVKPARPRSHEFIKPYQTQYRETVPTSFEDVLDLYKSA